MRKKIRGALRRSVSERARDLCEYCRSPQRIGGRCFGCTAHSVDHVIPVAHAGDTSLDNLALCCQGCNSRKSNRTHAIDPATGESAPLYNPRLQEWNDHFEWSADFLVVIGTTAIGRTTVAALGLNREGIVSLRRALRRLKQHPL
jgi:5-methylcytosine-specific restriction endonuclease McrA